MKLTFGGTRTHADRVGAPCACKSGTAHGRWPSIGLLAVLLSAGACAAILPSGPSEEDGREVIEYLIVGNQGIHHGFLSDDRVLKGLHGPPKS
jgi:hypothetical protein